MFRLLFMLLSTGSFVILFAFPLKAQVLLKTPKLQGDIVTFPIVLVNGYPFILGTINGVTGKFMFDTGLGASIMLNENYVQLPNKKSAGGGVTGSGQTFTTNMNDTIREIKFTNGITYRNLEKIKSGNYDFIQKIITPDFAGFIGYDFFKDYLFKIDYLHRKITFYKKQQERYLSKDFLTGEKVLAVIDFEMGKLENHPHVQLKIAGVNVLGLFDTGQNGYLQLDEASAKRLNEKGIVVISGTDSGGDTLLTIKDIVINGKLKATMKGVEAVSYEGTQVIRKQAGLTAANLMTFGFRFLSQYKTVWDYGQKKIYVLEY